MNIATTTRAWAYKYEAVESLLIRLGSKNTPTLMLVHVTRTNYYPNKTVIYYAEQGPAYVIESAASTQWHIRGIVEDHTDLKQFVIRYLFEPEEEIKVGEWIANGATQTYLWLKIIERYENGIHKQRG